LSCTSNKEIFTRCGPSTWQQIKVVLIKLLCNF
jgi:hypothetical protein